MTSIDGTSWLDVGDPTPLGWFTFAAYLFAALLAWRASRVCRWGFIALKSSQPLDANRQRRMEFWWLAVAVLMVLLGLNKELDLAQKLVRIGGKAAALQQGWYEHREAVQRAFIALLVMLSAVVAAVVLRVLRDVWTRIALASAGIALVVSYALLRAAMFNLPHASRPGLPVSSAWLIELAGIALVIWSSTRAARLPGGQRS